MNIIIDIALLIIVALSIWYGYKRGLIGSILGILAIIAALIAGSSLSANYAFEAVPVLEPFLNGYVDSQKTRDTVLEKMGYGSTDLSLDDVLATDSSLRYDYAVLCMEEIGFHEERAEELAERAVSYSDQNGVDMSEAVITILCDTITYVAGLTICFLLILILLVALGNVGNLVFRLPDSLELLDELGGALMGFVIGFLYCVLLCWLLSFLGLIIGKDTMDNTLLGRFFMSFRFLTNGLL
ncbi:MAG: CvpA family protein [Oscillospiraceae bacterium]|nr:CvpA family protein [Oscillospiraceae bacterium]